MTFRLNEQLVEREVSANRELLERLTTLFTPEQAQASAERSQRELAQRCAWMLQERADLRSQIQSVGRVSVTSRGQNRLHQIWKNRAAAPGHGSTADAF